MRDFISFKNLNSMTVSLFYELGDFEAFITLLVLGMWFKV
jgi:hypothetical protein